MKNIFCDKLFLTQVDKLLNTPRMNLYERLMIQLILVAVWSKAWAYSHLLAGSVGLNPARGMDVCLL